MVGTKKGKGTIWRATLASDPLVYTLTTTTVFTVVNGGSGGLALISAPTGGMGQFKGLT